MGELYDSSEHLHSVFVSDQTSNSGLTKEQVWDTLNDVIGNGFVQSEPVLIDALPGTGKSYGLIKWADESGEPITVLTERHDLYDQYEEWAEDECDLDARQLPVFHKNCPTAKERDADIGDSELISRYQPREEYHKDWREKVIQKYTQGISGRELHYKAATYFGEELPCQYDGSCPYMDDLDEDVDDVDVLIGNFRQVFAKRYRENRYVAFDEFPSQSFIQKFHSTTVAKTITRCVSNESDLPFENYGAVESYGLVPGTHPDVEEWLEQPRDDRDTAPLYRGTESQIDARGPLLTRIVLQFERLDNGWGHVDLGGGRVAVKSPKTDRISLLDPPLLDDTKGVIALGGTPCIEKWELLLGEELQHRSIFTNEQKREFLNEVLGIHFIQTTQEDTKPYAGGQTNTEADIALMEAIADREENQFSLISSKAAIEDYEDRDVDDLIDKKE